MIGSVFGLLAFFMLTSKFVQVFDIPAQGSVQRFYFLCVIAFAAGFSERWAQDTLTGGPERARPREGPAAPAAKSRRASRRPPRRWTRISRAD